MSQAAEPEVAARLSYLMKLSSSLRRHHHSVSVYVQKRTIARAECTHDDPVLDRTAGAFALTSLLPPAIETACGAGGSRTIESTHSQSASGQAGSCPVHMWESCGRDAR